MQALKPASLSRPRDVLGEFGLYAHIPFCVRRCWYCDFNAYAGLDHVADAYMDALVRDAVEALSAPDDADLIQRPTLTSIFIGGGTPSLVDARWIARLLDAVRSSWLVVPGAEVTIECNPESVSEAKLETYLRAGVNRISFGVQSLDNGLLARLGRTHDAATALRALRLAKAVGFDDVNADLIVGVPGEDDLSWRRSLDGVLECTPSHVSCYALTYEEGTPLAAWRRLGKVTPVDDDEVAARWETAESALSEAGLARYEISNWARPGRRSRHNSLYWACGEYLGVGAGAHSHLATPGGARRSWTVRSPERYARAIASHSRVVAGTEEIDQRTRATEVMALGLRRTDGVRAGHFAALIGAELDEVFGPELKLAASRGLISWDGENVRLANPLLGDEAFTIFA